MRDCRRLMILLAGGLLFAAMVFALLAAPGFLMEPDVSFQAVATQKAGR